tara:strand:+ start:3715 stop:3825 length:111 start_codon:yes stop_codon:yes gene_type:complete
VRVFFLEIMILLSEHPDMNGGKGGQGESESETMGGY